MRAAIAILVAATACGKVTSGLEAGSDGGGDGGGAADAALPGPVEVTVLSRGDRAPLADVPVYFFGPDGAHEETVTTDGDGVATADLRAGGAVFARLPPPTKVGAPLSDEVWGVVDVRPGDEILLAGYHDRGMQLTAEHDMTITLPVDGSFTTYVVSTTCGVYVEEDNVVTIHFHENCQPDTFAWIALGQADADRYYIIGDEEAERSDGGDIAVADGWTLAGSDEIEVTDIPAQVGDLVATLTDARLGGTYLFTASLGGSSVDAASSAVFIEPRHVDGVDELGLTLNVYNDSPGLGKQEVLRWSDGGDDTPPVSLEDELLPWVGTPIYEAAERRFAWPLAGEGSWDATGINLSWSKMDGDGFISSRWTIIGPPGVHEVVLPALPEDLAELLPEDIDSASVAIQLVDSDGLDGWDAARPLGLDTWWEGWYTDPRAGATTRLSFDPPIEI